MSTDNYETSMRLLCTVYRGRDALLAGIVREETERMRWMLTAATLWLSAKEAQRALDHIEDSAHHTALRMSIEENIERSYTSSRACYHNAGFDQSPVPIEVNLKASEMQHNPSDWQSDVQSDLQSVGPDGEDMVLNLFSP